MKNIKFLIVFPFLMMSCSAERQLQKAEQKVKLNPQSFQKLGLAWAGLNPCVNDTVISLVEAAIDSVEFAEYLKYANAKNLPKQIDSLPAILALYFNYGYDEAVRQLGKIKVPKAKTITKTAYVTGNRAVNIANDSIQKLNVKNALLIGQIGAFQTNMAKVIKKSTTYQLLFFAMVVLTLLYLIFTVYKKIKL